MRTLTQTFSGLGLASLLALASGRLTGASAEMTPVDRGLLERCCTTASYGKADPRSLILTSPAAVNLRQYLPNSIPDAAPKLIVLVEQIVQATRMTVIQNPPLDYSGAVGSRLAVILIPPRRSDVTAESVNDIKSSFGILDNKQYGPGVPKGVDGLLDIVYSRKEYALFHVRGQAANGKVTYAIFVVKPSRDEEALPLTFRALLEGFGYNADNQTLPDSLFADSTNTEVTKSDIEALRQLYQR